MALKDDLREQAEEAFDLSYLDEAQLWLGWRVIRRKVLPVVIPSIKNFLYDPQAFAAYMRMMIFALGTALHEGIIPGGMVAWWAGLVFQVGSLVLAAGQTNLTPGTMKAIVENPETTVTPKDEKVAAVAVEKAAAKEP